MSDMNYLREREIARIAARLGFAWDTGDDQAFHDIAGKLWAHIGYRYGFDFVLDGSALILGEMRNEAAPVPDD
jgi:hypothetical protein